MSDNARVSRLTAGQIVLVDWWGDALPKEPNKLRPAIVIDEDGLFASDFQNSIVVPLTEDERMVILGLTLSILPTSDNGCKERCWAASYLVTTASKRRMRSTPSCVTAEQLAVVRQQVARAIGA
jgi:mRNA-degrading endonuclease toxin of MazEF toxin-antitoxin module